MTPEHLIRDQQYIFLDLPAESLSIGSIVIPCLVPDDNEGNDWVAGGTENQPRASVIVPRNVTFVPLEGQHASYREQAWRIAAVKRDHINSPVRIDLEKLI